MEDQLLYYYLKKIKIILDEEIINNSLNGFETYVKYGEKIGEKKK